MMKNLLKYTLVIAFVIGTIVLLDAQCPMCKMSAESNLKNGGTEGNSLNAGILYLLALPYTAILIFATIWYRNKKKEEAEKAA